MSDALNVLKKLLDDFSVSAWLIDDEENIVHMNPLMQELFGNLSGNKTSIIYDSGSYHVDAKPEEDGGSATVIITDVPFRKLAGEVDLGEGGRYRVELFEDISEERLMQTKMSQTLEKISRETKTAQTIQNSILPIDDIYWNTIAFSSLYVPADDLGGDFYDILRLSDDEYLIYIADVSGHGIQASLLTMFMSERVRINTEAAAAGTSTLLSKLVHDFNALDMDNMMYITMIICKYTKSRRELSVSNAGHGCYPLILRDSGRAETIPTQGLPVCAIAEDFDYEEEIVSMRPGDRLILFTDGIVEEVDSARGHALGSEGVRSIAEKYHEYSGSYLARTIIDESTKFSLIGAKDDRTIVIADVLS